MFFFWRIWKNLATYWIFSMTKNLKGPLWFFFEEYEKNLGNLLGLLNEKESQGRPLCISLQNVKESQDPKKSQGPFVNFSWRIWKNFVDLLDFINEKQSQGPFFCFWRIWKNLGNLLGFLMRKNFRVLLWNFQWERIARDICVFFDNMRASHWPFRFYHWERISGTYTLRVFVCRIWKNLRVLL